MQNGSLHVFGFVLEVLDHLSLRMLGAQVGTSGGKALLQTLEELPRYRG